MGMYVIMNKRKFCENRVECYFEDYPNYITHFPLAIMKPTWLQREGWV